MRYPGEKKRGQKKKLYMTQKSDLKQLMSNRQPLVLLVYKEILLNTSEMAGSIPSIIVSYLQDCSCLHTEKARIRWKEPHEIEGSQSEVMVVVNTTAMRYVLIPSWIYEILYFKHYGLEFVSEVSRLKGIMIISLDLLLRSWEIVFATYNSYRIVGLIEIVGNNGWYAFVLFW